MVLYTANVSNNHDLLLEKAEQTMKALSVRKGSHGNDTTCEPSPIHVTNTQIETGGQFVKHLFYPLIYYAVFQILEEKHTQIKITPKIREKKLTLEIFCNISEKIFPSFNLGVCDFCENIHKEKKTVNVIYMNVIKSPLYQHPVNIDNEQFIIVLKLDVLLQFD